MVQQADMAGMELLRAYVQGAPLRHSCAEHDESYFQRTRIEGVHALMTGNPTSSSALANLIWTHQKQATELLSTISGDEGLPLLLAKGAYYTLGIHQGHVMGRRGDIDVYINKKDWPAWQSALAKFGYEESKMDTLTGQLIPLTESERATAYVRDTVQIAKVAKAFPFTPGQALLDHRTLNTNAYIHPTFVTPHDSKIIVAINFHHSLVAGMPSQRFFSHSKIAHSHLHCLTPADALWHSSLLYYLDVALKLSTKLPPLFDIAKLAGEVDIDWEHFLAIARELQIYKPFFYTMDSINLICDAQVFPQSVVTSLRDETSRRFDYGYQIHKLFCVPESAPQFNTAR
ncbi:MULTISPECIES: nucleotidyltransferase family protein [unclassified Pseudomonas]|uniref:nucleotidyltransferase family protein n=1 Tax=unclassified Pseudomonas TaxID=196821 RepID=UPI0030DA273F